MTQMNWLFDEERRVVISFNGLVEWIWSRIWSLIYRTFDVKTQCFDLFEL